MKISVESEKDRFGLRAVGVMLDEKNRVLLCQLEGDPLWVLPGGNIGLHETHRKPSRENSLKKPTSK